MPYAVGVGDEGSDQGQRIGFIGLGNIGSGMCANLLADGHRVTAFDVDPERLATQVEAGAAAGKSPEDVAANSDITFLSLPTPEIMAAVSEEWLRGAAAGLAAGRPHHQLTGHGAPVAVASPGQDAISSKRPSRAAPSVPATASSSSSSAGTPSRWPERCPVL